MTDVVFSGIEGSLDEIETMLKHGYKVDNFMTAFSSFRKSSSFIDKLKELKQTYGFKLFVDSGAHAFVFAQNVKDKKTHGGWHDEAQIVKEFKGHEDDYFQEYLQWLKDNRDVYDYAVELDLQGIVGQEKVEEWRQQLLDSQIPIIFVLHAPAGDNIATIRSWHERGVEYIGMGEIVNDLNKFVMYGREAAKLGMKLHAFGFTPKDLFKYKAFLTTADSSSWLSGSKLAKAVELRGKSLVDINLNDDKIKKASLLNNEFFTIYDIDEVRKKTAGKQYWFFNFWNLFQMQKWTNVNNGKKGYVEQLKVAEETGQPLPAWANAFDKAGRPKTQYLRSRFNGYKSGAFARQVQKFAMYCNNCPVGGASGDAPLCPMYEAGSVCLGADTFICGDNKDIVQSEEGDFVFGRNGYATILHKFERDYDGDMYRIKAAGILEFMATPEHPLLTVQIKRIQHTVGTEKVIKGMSWKKINELNTSHNIYTGRDYLVIPRLDGIFEDVKFGEFILDENLAWLMGVYTAEGWTNDSRGTISFSIAKYEEQFGNDIINAGSNINIHISKGETRTAEVYITGKTSLTELMKKLCGKGAINKKIPQEILLNKDTKILEAYLKGYETGDGCDYKATNKMVIGTISRTLAFQLQLAYARLGKFAYITIEKRNGKTAKIEGRTVNIRDAYGITYVTKFKLNNDAGKRHIITDDSILVPIIKIEKFHYAGKVYNMETTQSEYLANNIVSHNCYFLPMWNKLGMKTRNKKEVDITLQNLVADAYARYQFARMTEQMTGVVDKNVTSLYESLVKSLDLYNRVRFGVANTNTINMLNVGDNKVSVRIGSEEALNKVRDLYGEEMTNRIKKRIEKMETVDTDYEERGDENGE